MQDVVCWGWESEFVGASAEVGVVVAVGWRVYVIVMVVVMVVDAEWFEGSWGCS